MVTLIDCVLTLSFSPNTIVKKNAMTKLRASVTSNAPASSAQAVPAATVAKSQGNRYRNTRQGDASRTWAR